MFIRNLTIAVVALALLGTARADDLKFEVLGISEPLLSNVQNQITTIKIGRQARLSEKDLAPIVANTISRARLALRPYGYYQPNIEGSMRATNAESWTLTLKIDRGPPIIVDGFNVALQGEGSNMRVLRDWRREWPLRNGDVLNQAVWESEKERALEIAASVGFLSAKFAAKTLQIDLENNTAKIDLVLETGPRFAIGDIDFGEHVLKPGIVEYIPRFKSGDNYNRRLLETFRVDLWKSGYFTNVEVLEVQRPDATPPVVDLKLKLETENRNFYQGSLGVGSDTGMRAQAQWARHPMSSKGDRVDLGIGWQEADEEFSLRGTYRLPRPKRASEFWVSDLIIRKENLDLDVKRTPEDPDFIKVANGNVEERHLRVGRLDVRNLKSGEKQILETLFVQYLNASREFLPLATVAPDLDGNIARDDFLKGLDKTLSVGGEWDIISVSGSGFESSGHRDRIWLFHSDKAFGSDVDFSQLYLSTRRSYMLTPQWKLLLRAEVGYTNAPVDDFILEVNDEPLQMSVTQLPNFYRFKTGGSSTVRGYGFEELSNNRVGSNNLVTASAEIEYRYLPTWSVAAFVDIGNAFNDWESADLKKGVGVGLRWYSIAGPIRIDVARAQDFAGKPWRLHFTIGTPLL